ncbi:MAG TPA: glycoside hydrolase family 71/99-like protein [Luteolibacter sp.]|nr:glycoside hydrolase family 71/99-like protein [Luteolibacter sp.]
MKPPLLLLLLSTIVGAEPYSGPSVRGVDVSTLTGKVMAGYQGWFNCEGDGAGLGWTHWSKDRKLAPGPETIRVDLWPDVSEYAPEELYATGFKWADGSPAKLFSSHTKATVLRHFEWMRGYGIDGVFVQRFATGLKDPKVREHRDLVLSHCREGANRNGRAYALMYDLSGLPAGGVAAVIEDWKALRKQMKMGEDPAYLHHRGKPLVAVWGVGFNDDRKYDLAECRALVEALVADGCSVMLGVPTGWRELTRDSVRDPKLHEVLKLATVISPWTPGRYRTPAEAATHAGKFWGPDQAWCRERSIDYLPVVFPGFSWHNLKPDAPFDAIPRLKGEFLWSQFVGAQKAGAGMVYVAMFDEVDEATAIFKCSQRLPAGPTRFVTEEGLPSDHYLWLTGEATRRLRAGEVLPAALPERGK